MKRNALLIGGFVLAAIAIAIAAVFWLSGQDLFGQQVKARVYYEGNVSGLSVGAPVTFRGVSVGQVTEIGIEVDPSTLETSIPVSLKLQPSAVRYSNEDKAPPLDIPSLVQRGLRARLTSQSVVTGQKAIELDFIPESPARLHGPPGTLEIPTVAERFGALIDQVADLPLRDTVNDLRSAVADFRSTMQSVQRTLDGTQEVLSSTAKEITATGVQSRQTLEAATRAIQQVQASTAASLEAVTRLADTSRQTVVEAQPDLQRTLAGAREASESARLALDRIADVAAPGAPLRNDLDTAMRDLAQAARGLRSLTELLEEKPNAVIFGNPRE
ncbi:MlaD family protein [Aquincola sp. MAHUQ-54]|uniref:MlaD family protein n=1 Tax=Aquincola agrisoli TaxID=3119538 RepID=A0AAW9QEC5_9BURK